MKNIFINFILLAVLAIYTFDSNAASTRKIEAQYLTNSGKTLAVPSADDTLVGAETSDTFKNKVMSGADNTFSAIPASAVDTVTDKLSGDGTASYVPYYTATNILGNEAAFNYTAITDTLSVGNVISSNLQAGIVQGGTAASGNLLFKSTSDATKGSVFSDSDFTLYAGKKFTLTGLTSGFTVSFKADDATAAMAYTLPASYGSSGAVLVTNGSGGLSWSHDTHNSLSGLNDGDYKHLTATEYSTLTGGGLNPVQEVATGDYNGVDLTYTLSHTPASQAGTAVYLDGLLLEYTTDYTLATNVLTLVDAPVAGQKLIAYYNY